MYYAQMRIVKIVVETMLCSYISIEIKLEDK